MKKGKRLKENKLTISDIDEYCNSVEETLTKIYKRCSSKENKKRKKKELVYCMEDAMYY